MNQQMSGVVIAKVINPDDPDGLGKVEINFPWLSEENKRWVSVSSIMAGSDRGAFFMPEKGDEVLVAFDHGNFDHAYIIGCMWNPVHASPSQDYRQRMIRSKNGHTIRFVDSTPVAGNNGALIIEDGHGNTITMTNTSMRFDCLGKIEIKGLSVSIQGREVLGSGVI